MKLMDFIGKDSEQTKEVEKEAKDKIAECKRQ